jgi:anti-sigma factor (TIGR02949 family)
MPNDVRPIDCRLAMQRLWDFLDQELTEDRMAEVRRHLESCERCLPHHEFAQRFLQAMQSTRAEQLMPPEVRLKVLIKLQEAGFSAS